MLDAMLTPNIDWQTLYCKCKKEGAGTSPDGEIEGTRAIDRSSPYVTVATINRRLA